ncbi:hypothetical protein IPL68_06330 [Candidatus Saccharibacteria bacterium]|nr:MAG: hypothetical protein IPL68_06330 [Candidatus Saccharibacteria bacterium]
MSNSTTTAKNSPPISVFIANIIIANHMATILVKTNAYLITTLVYHFPIELEAEWRQTRRARKLPSFNPLALEIN